MIKSLLRKIIKKPGLLSLKLSGIGCFLMLLALFADLLGFGSSGSQGLGPAQVKLLLMGGCILIFGIIIGLPSVRDKTNRYILTALESIVNSKWIGYVDMLLSRIGLLLLGCLFALFIAEIALRIYSPFILRIKGDMIELPRNLQLEIENQDVEKLDQFIVHSKNSLGFRGDDPPIDFNDYLTIVTVGGSTAECYYLSDGKTWTDDFGRELSEKIDKVWVNNAGLDGHSTFGHSILMRDYVTKFEPDFVFFLIGLNDLAVNTPRSYEEWIIDQENDIGGEREITKPRDQEETGVTGICLSSFGCFLESVAPYSNLANLLWNLTKANEAYVIDLGHNSQLDLTKSNMVTMDDAEVDMIVNTYQKEYIPSYRERVNDLIQTSIDHGIEPVLITQPVLFGKGFDDVTGVDLENIEVSTGISGKVQWQILELYNDVLREIGQDRNILVIDLAREMPKSSAYYYDFYHYTNEGSQVIGDILFDDFYPYLLENGYQN